MEVVRGKVRSETRPPLMGLDNFHIELERKVSDQSMIEM